MLPQQQITSRWVGRPLVQIGRKQIAGKAELMRKPLVGVEVELQIQLRSTLVHDREVLFQLGPPEGIDHLFGEGGKILSRV